MSLHDQDDFAGRTPEEAAGGSRADAPHEDPLCAGASSEAPREDVPHADMPSDAAAPGVPANAKPPRKGGTPSAIRRKRAFTALAALAAVAAALLLIRAFVPGADGWLEPAAEQGRYEGWDEQSVRDDLDRQVEEGMMAVSVSSSIIFEDGQAEGEARIENVPGNRVDQKVVLTLDDTGEVLYESKALAPGTHVQRIRLARDLEPGDYAATMVFTGYDRETHERRGSAGVQVTLHVLN